MFCNSVFNYREKEEIFFYNAKERKVFSWKENTGKYREKNFFAKRENTSRKKNTKKKQK